MVAASGESFSATGNQQHNNFLRFAFRHYVEHPALDPFKFFYSLFSSFSMGPKILCGNRLHIFVMLGSETSFDLL